MLTEYFNGLLPEKKAKAPKNVYCDNAEGIYNMTWSVAIGTMLRTGRPRRLRPALGIGGSFSAGKPGGE